MSCIKCIVIVIVLQLFALLIEINESDAQSVQINQKNCQLCEEIVNGILDRLKQGATDLELVELAIQQCKDKMHLSYACDGIMNSSLDIASFILRTKPNLTAQFICSILLQGMGCPRNSTDNPIIPIVIDSNRPELNSSKSFIPSCKNHKKIIVVQITDTHVDRSYKAGGNANCGIPVCCRKGQGEPSDANSAAGMWGDYRNCDPPLKAFINALQRIKAAHKQIDYIYYTGDTVDHGVWETTAATNQQKLELTFDLIRIYFPNIPIIPIIGNHEPHPVSQFSPANTANNISSVEMYKSIAKYWDWLPPEARKSIQIGGYYTMLLRKGLRIIAMNNNDIYTYNLWLIFDPTFPAKQMQWLHDTLLMAEKNKEKVHILAHIPINDKDFFNLFSPVFRKIVDRYWKTISGIFNGHTHTDELALFYSLDKPYKAVNVAWNGGSITPYSYVNPNYKIYEVEPKTFQVVDQLVYIYNLTEANKSGRPKWFKEYSFLEAYELTNLSPASLDGLLDKMIEDSEKLELYWKRKSKMGDLSLKAGCSKACLLGHLCRIIDTGLESERCSELVKKYQTILATDSKLPS